MTVAEILRNCGARVVCTPYLVLDPEREAQYSDLEIGRMHGHNELLRVLRGDDWVQVGAAINAGDAHILEPA